MSEIDLIEDVLMPDVARQANAEYASEVRRCADDEESRRLCEIGAHEKRVLVLNAAFRRRAGILGIASVVTIGLGIYLATRKKR